MGPLRYIVFAFITSRVPSKLLDTDILLDATESDFASTGLRVSSTLQLHHVMTTKTTLIQRELGQLPVRIQRQVKHQLRQLFELA